MIYTFSVAFFLAVKSSCNPCGQILLKDSVHVPPTLLALAMALPPSTMDNATLGTNVLWKLVMSAPSAPKTINKSTRTYNKN